jgi:RNase P subunit RPR2
MNTRSGRRPLPRPAPMYSPAMRWQLRRPHMVERTCLQCGEHWTVSKRAPRTVPRGWSGRGRARPFGVARLGAFPSNASMHYMLEDAHGWDANEGREVEKQEFRICPKCGGMDRYTERRVS